MDLVRFDERPSRKARDACFATFALVFLPPRRATMTHLLPAPVRSQAFPAPATDMCSDCFRARLICSRSVPPFCGLDVGRPARAPCWWRAHGVVSTQVQQGAPTLGRVRTGVSWAGEGPNGPAGLTPPFLLDPSDSEGGLVADATHCIAAVRASHRRSARCSVPASGEPRFMHVGPQG